MHVSFQFNDFFRRPHVSNPDQNDKGPPTFLVQSGVDGDLKIRDLNEDLVNDERARLEIELEGIMRTELDTCVQSSSEFRVTVEKKILSMTQAIPMQAYSRDVVRNERHYPFNFDVQSWLKHDQAGNIQQRDLASRSNFASIPPSMRHEVLKTQQGMPKPRAGARVTYRLTARLLSDHRTIDRVIQPILLLMSQSPSPPVCMTDFGGEYRLSQSTVLRGQMFQRVGGLTVMVREPKQLTIRPGCELSMVELPIRLELQPSGRDLGISDRLVVEADVRWNFRFMTFVSLSEQQGPPTLKQALVSPTTAFVTSSLKTRSLRLCWRNWKDASNGKSSLLTSEQSLWLALSRSEVLTPTFWTPFLSRRYSISLQIKVLQPGNAKLVVEVPIQVGIEDLATEGVQQGLGSMNNVERRYCSMFDDAEPDELLPQYSRRG